MLSEKPIAHIQPKVKAKTWATQYAYVNVSPMSLNLL